jgi:hypothetical protein
MHEKKQRRRIKNETHKYEQKKQIIAMNLMKEYIKRK